MSESGVIRKIKKFLKTVKLKDEEGSAMVEAAIVMPLVLLAVLEIIIVTVFLTESLFMQVNIHSYLRHRSGEMSETRITESIEDYKETVERKKIVKRLNVKEQHYMKGGYLLPKPMKKFYSADSYVINEKEIIRYKDFFDDEIF